jgi:hypothetical protein
MPTLETLRPSITNQDYLDRLYDMGIFDKKLDVWAYCVAYALGKGLGPADDNGSQMGSDLVHLDGDLLRTLIMAYQNQSGEDGEDQQLVNVLSGYASSGIADIRQQTEGKSRTEIYEFLLGRIQT